MPPRYLNSAAAVFLERNSLLDSLRVLAKARLEENHEMLAVVLFGSLSRGDHGRRSDADLLLWLQAPQTERPADRIPRYLKLFLEAPVPIDVFPFTDEEIRRGLGAGSTFWRRVRAEAILLAGVMPPSLHTG